MIKIKHNLKKEDYMWLWAKYVKDGNDEKHCTACLKGKYSKVFSAHNEEFNETKTIEFNEEKEGSFKAIYLCGVIKKGYSAKKNYPHNLHLAITPKEGHNELFMFEDKMIQVIDGEVSRIIDEEELPEKYQTLEEKYTTCRIFRWMIGYFYKDKDRDVL